ncbi:hypothetical protein DYH10_03215 [Candidatus Saccharibacteria bacterium CPR2]|nr:hypothetical protein [Candidatus Saccharibacteria bacterium CPR2]
MSKRINILLKRYKNRPESHPTIILGQFERVGSTYVLDTYEKTNIVHNEPYKQLVPTEWPISCRYDDQLSTIDDFLLDKKISLEHKYWLYNFVLSRYSPGSQVLKETSLHLALPQFLELFPYHKLKVLSRNPLGIVSSFKRNDLYELWKYDKTRARLDIQIKSGADKYSRLTCFTNNGSLWDEKLMWLIGLNSIILSCNLANMVYDTEYYDDLIKQSNPTNLKFKNKDKEDSIFTTNICKEYDDFDRRLTNTEIRRLKSTAESCIDYVYKNFNKKERLLFDRIFGFYFLGNEANYTSKRTQNTMHSPRVNTSTPGNYKIVERDELYNYEEKYIRMKGSQNVLWAKGLVTNEAMCHFLNNLLSAGFRSSLNYLLVRDNMPPERGGRIIYNKSSNRFVMVKGFEKHPVYWVSWLCASIFAKYCGRKLPTIHQWMKAFYANKSILINNQNNHSYLHDDVVPTGKTYKGLPKDFFGNLKVWCRDWDISADKIMLSKNLAGISWKHYYHDKYKICSEKPFLTNSRVIGIRLVTSQAVSKERTIYGIVEDLNDINDIIAKSDIRTPKDASRLNEAVSDILDGS